MKGLSPASRLQAEMMAEQSMVYAHPCPTVEYTILPETCENRQQAWLVDFNPARKCIGPECARFRVDPPPPPEPDPLDLPFPEEEPPMDPTKEPVKAVEPVRLCKTCDRPMITKPAPGSTGNCRKCAARVNHAAWLKTRVAPPARKAVRGKAPKAARTTEHLDAGPREDLFTRAADGAVLDRYGHKHIPCPGEGCTRWISARSKACASCAKKGVPKPKLAAVLKAGHAVIRGEKPILQANHDGPVGTFQTASEAVKAQVRPSPVLQQAIEKQVSQAKAGEGTRPTTFTFPPHLPPTFGQMIPKDPERTGYAGPLQAYRDRLDTERVLREYPSLLARIERLEAALFRLGEKP